MVDMLAVVAGNGLAAIYSPAFKRDGRQNRLMVLSSASQV